MKSTKKKIQTKTGKTIRKTVRHLRFAGTITLALPSNRNCCVKKAGIIFRLKSR